MALFPVQLLLLFFKGCTRCEGSTRLADFWSPSTRKTGWTQGNSRSQAAKGKQFGLARVRVCVRARACMCAWRLAASRWVDAVGCLVLWRGVVAAGEFEAEVDFLKLLARAEADEARVDAGGEA